MIAYDLANLLVIHLKGTYSSKIVYRRLLKTIDEFLSLLSLWNHINLSETSYAPTFY